MRNVGVGLGLGVAVALMVGGMGFERGSVYGQHGANASLPDGGLLAFQSTASDGSQQISLIDPMNRIMGVYRVDLASGAISLRSVRNIRWDLLMDEFNAGNPPPQDIRALVEQRR